MPKMWSHRRLGGIMGKQMMKLLAMKEAGEDQAIERHKPHYRRQGAIFEGEIAASLRLNQDVGEPIWFIKNVDTNLYDKKSKCPKCGLVFETEIILPKVASDFTVTGKKSVVYVECKSTVMDRFPIANVSNHQIEWGLELNESDVISYILLINHRVTNSPPLPKINEVYMISITNFCSLLIDRGSKSISFFDLRNSGKAVRLNRNSGGTWDLSRIIMACKFGKEKLFETEARA